MKKMILIVFLLVGKTSFSQDYKDSLMIHGMRMDSLEFELRLDTVRQMMLIYRYRSETEIEKLVDIIEEIRDIQDKAIEDKEKMLFEAKEVIRFHDKLNSKEL